MQTVITTSPEEAAEYVRRGGVVAFPTETVYGLGANIFDERALHKIFSAKQRPADNPLIAHIAETGQIAELSDEIIESAKKFIDAFFPGPLTIVVRKTRSVPLIATAGLDTIGIRMAGSALANRFLSACSTPVAAPSANLSGRPSPTTWEAVFEDLGGRIDCILKGGRTEIGIESTVVDCTSRVPRLLRSGSISVEQLRGIVPETEIYSPNKHTSARSPGMRHRHYSPNARVIIIENTAELSDEPNAAFIGVSRPSARFRQQQICLTEEEYARSVFEFFRECDRAEIKIIYCESVSETGIGTALMDRIRRAAE